MRVLRLVPILPVVLGMVILCGCAAVSQSSATASADEPDCSFRSATTCWTLAGRFPPRPSEAGEPDPNEAPRAPTALASRADSASGSR
jgi:hypothetical protein